MILQLGDFTTSETVYVPFHTFDSNGASVTLTGLAVTDIEIYKDGSTTQRSSDAGYTLLDTDGIDFDTITGLHGFSIDLSDNTDAGFYANGSQYMVAVSAVTVDSQTVNFWAGTFTIGRMLRPTTTGRTLDVAATGEAGVDLGNVTGTLGNSNVSWIDANDRTDVGSWLGNAVTASAGNPDVNVESIDDIDFGATMKASINTEVDTGLTDIGLDHLVGAAVTGTDVTDDSIVAKLVSSSATADFDDFVNTTDSLQANADALAVVDGNVDSILVDTAEIGAAGAGLTDLGGMSTAMKAEVNAEADTAISDAALATAANLATVDTVVDAIQVVTDALGATAAANLKLSGEAMVAGTVDTVTNTHTPTTTEFQADDITEATADHFNGRSVIFTSGVLQNQATDITDYAAVGGIGQFTVTAMTEAPANNDTFIII